MKVNFETVVRAGEVTGFAIGRVDSQLHKTKYLIMSNLLFFENTNNFISKIFSWFLLKFISLAVGHGAPIAKNFH